VTKVWENAAGVLPDGTMAEVQVECRNVWVSGSLQTAGTSLVFYSPDTVTESFSPGTANEADDDDTTDDVTACRALEVNIDSSEVESDQGCAADTVFEPGGESPKGCTITNSVFFEGIPALGPKGLAILVLLMLGAGAIAARRFG
jgi:hypothetical protein